MKKRWGKPFALRVHRARFDVSPCLRLRHAVNAKSVWCDVIDVTWSRTCCGRHNKPMFSDSNDLYYERHNYSVFNYLRIYRHPYKLYKQHSSCTTRSSFFTERVVNIWNSLPAYIQHGFLVSQDITGKQVKTNRINHRTHADFSSLPAFIRQDGFYGV